MMQSLLSVMKAYLSRTRSAYNWQCVGNNAHAGISLFARLVRFLQGKLTSNMILFLITFVRQVFSWRTKVGTKGAAMRLKVSALAIMKFLAGDAIHDTRPLGVAVELTSGGLPKWLPIPVRRLLAAHNSLWIRLVLTLCGLYRVMDYRGVFSTDTITQPGVPLERVLPRYIDFVVTFFIRLVSILPSGFDFSLPEWESLPILKSAPGTTSQSVIQTSVSALLRHVSMISRNEVLRSSLLGIMGMVKGPVRSFRILEGLAQVQGRFWPIFQPYFVWVYPFGRPRQAVMEEGRLGLKHEPGKVRVFAMVDWWTQMALRPLHLLIFSILRRIPQDGTFDQMRLVRWLQEVIRNRQEQGLNPVVYSLDLSAATDRLPISIQVLLVEFLVPGLGQWWRSLLVERSYSSPGVRDNVRYAVGQPMGALSSWAMLAFTHHFIVQYASARVGRTGWFADYGILGDDIVILDEEVALSYLEVMKELGVSINLSKSLISPSGHFEFAKKFASPTELLSGISLAEVSVAGGSLAALKEMMTRNSLVPSWAAVVAFFGKGPFAVSRMDRPFHKISRSLMGLIIWCSQPIMPFPSRASSWSQWFNLQGRGRFSNRGNWLDILKRIRGFVYDRVPAHEDALEEQDLGSLLFAEPFNNDETIFPSYYRYSEADQAAVLVNAIKDIFPKGINISGFTTSFPFWAFEGGANDASRVDQGVPRALQFLGENTPMEDWAMSSESELGAMAVRPSDDEGSIAYALGLRTKSHFSVGSWLHLWHQCQVDSAPAPIPYPTVADLLSKWTQDSVPLPPKGDNTSWPYGLLRREGPVEFIPRAAQSAAGVIQPAVPAPATEASRDVSQMSKVEKIKAETLKRKSKMTLTQYIDFTAALHADINGRGDGHTLKDVLASINSPDWKP